MNKLTSDLIASKLSDADPTEDYTDPKHLSTIYRHLIRQQLEGVFFKHLKQHTNTKKPSEAMKQATHDQKIQSIVATLKE